MDRLRHRSAHRDRRTRQRLPINIPFAGTLDTGSGPERTLATERRAAVYRLDRNSYLRGWGNGARILGLKIDRLELEDQLAGMIDRPVTSPIEFELSMNLGTKHGAQWLDVVKVLAAHLTDSDSLVRHPLLAAPLAQSVMAGLLLASEHNYSTDLSRTPARTRAPSSTTRSTSSPPTPTNPSPSTTSPATSESAPAGCSKASTLRAASAPCGTCATFG